ncbi:hypothetical protein AGABI2DRAFT_193868 [Agaricus bisporus var. bisporus H97]|uniref:hypothetical protein n=1 Tax=Agaricus bisporus var. bisporus (strain H97 / ATCC MYA-4626 / FGSC 10389) TaxID=936046 RepID=UPI00029F4F4D|nr:hypothetical protein AGABI2DRAFT_193868 [Agaricus bisporus var. bisporus H97]EKV45947.1 hypothetical protein AGABI2DRAFT_193868 [Agaricus bisporus var. bisporus H97]
MRTPLPLLGIAAQLPFSTPPKFNPYNTLDALSPVDLAGLERPSAALPNIAGDLAFVTVSKYDFEKEKFNQTLVVFPVESTFTSAEVPLPKGGEAFWLTGTTLAHVVEGENDNLELYALEVRGSYNNATTSDGPLKISSKGTLIGTFPTKSASNFKYNPHSRHLVFADNVYEDFDLDKVKERDREWSSRGTSAMVYDSTPVRFWDFWVGPKKGALFSVPLYMLPDHTWYMGREFFSPLKESSHHTPVELASDDFDVSATQIIYTAKDPALPDAWHTRQNIYIVDIRGATKSRQLTSGKQGSTHNPVFNHQGDKVAWIEIDEDGIEGSRAKIVIYDLKVNVRYTLTQHWDRSVQSITFNKEGTFIYFTAGDHAKVKVFYLPVPPTPPYSTTDPILDDLYTKPTELTSTGSVTGIHTMYTGRLLFSRSSLTSPNDAYLIQHLPRYLSDLTQPSEGVAKSLKGDLSKISGFTEAALRRKWLHPGEEFYFTGANDKKIHGWAFKPRGWKEGDKKKWPVVLMIHGGPQSAWLDDWSTRWNQNVFTGKGYFVICINPTGSTTFGQELTDAITEDWGGKPFVDLINGWTYALEKYPEIDADRAVGAGASWGGYAINWIQSNPEFGFNFKALVCHDGVFDTRYSGLSTDVPFLFNGEWGGRPWEEKNKKLSEKFSPSNFVHKWSTPELIIHSSKDYRLPETEGITAFHALQQLGVPSRLVIFPDENHWILNPGNSIAWHDEVFRWIDQFIGENSTNVEEI